VRAWEPISTAARAAANGTGVTVIDAPVLANGRLELRWYYASRRCRGRSTATVT
jgi:hypothetical protein